MRQLLGLGHTLLTASSPSRATATSDRHEIDRGPDRPTTPLKHDRRYVSIFGELTISRVVYGTREGQKIERVPLDERLGLPEDSFSYVLEDWAQRLCLKESFAEAGHRWRCSGAAAGEPDAGADEPGLAGYAPPFRAAIEPPPAEEEGPLLVVTADGKGVPMRRPARRAPSPTTAGPRERRRTRSRWPASGRCTASSRSSAMPTTSSTRCCGTRRPSSGPSRSTSTSGRR